MTQRVTADQFSRALKKYREVTIKEAVVQRQKEVAKAVWAGIITKHPVDTGLSRNNWNASLDNPDSSTTDELSPAARGEALTPEEEERLNTVLARLDDLPLGQSIWLSNSIHYVKFLEGGTSKMPPFAMVRTTIAEILAYINSRA